MTKIELLDRHLEDCKALNKACAELGDRILCVRLVASEWKEFTLDVFKDGVEKCMALYEKQNKSFDDWAKAPED